jgi:cob(I)alamin adenosyltransferase
VVRLTRIYTRGGDKGKTSLADGKRVAKHDRRVAAMGTVDEANATIGLVRLHTKGDADAMLARIQNDLFDVGADLARPRRRGAKVAGLRVTASQVSRLEAEIDRLNAELKPLDSFVLPGGGTASAYLHLARTVIRRAERSLTELGARAGLNPELVRYLNRLSDHLFVLARFLNDHGRADVLWQPGLHR